MRAIERVGYLSHARSAVFGRRLERARTTIREMLARCHCPYVAFSAGKDSSVLLWLVLEQRPDAAGRILTSGETRLLHANLDDVLGWWRLRFPALDLMEINVDRVFAEGWEEATWHAQRKAGRGDIVRLLPTSGLFDGVFMGLRDEESNARRIANKRGRIRRYANTRRDNTAALWACCPLSDWTTDDVGALICLHDVPLLSAYQAEGLEARTTMRLTGDAVRQNALVALRQRDPGRYNQLIARFPEIDWWAG